MLTQAQRQEWIARLRSGEIQQITGQISDHCGGRCCLGVLSDILGLDTYILREYPSDVRALSRQDQVELIGINDSQLLSFPAIADYLETHPELAPAEPEQC